MTRKEWKDVAKRMIESFPPDTLVDGNFEDKAVVILLMKFYKSL